tara:strand:+ start:14836 stop:15435 length:600 start_codon:yes stop_codon:yes gene_type:complete
MNVLYDYVPINSLENLNLLLKNLSVEIEITKNRKTKYGDFKFNNGNSKISINKTSNKYRFLITLIHEIAHFLSYSDFGYKIKPHGNEWKNKYKKIMKPFLHSSIFPPKLLLLLKKHMAKPKASSDSDSELSIEIKKYDINLNSKFIFELIVGDIFMFNLKNYQILKKRVKKYECLNLNTNKKYLFSPHVQVSLINVQND